MKLECKDILFCDIKILMLFYADLESNQGSAIRSFSHTSVDEEVTKGRAVQAQLGK